MKSIFIFVAPLLILPSICGTQSGLRPEIFIQYNEKMTWKQAQSHCRKKHMDLVSIRGEEDNEGFRRGTGWIGLYREENDSLWKWSRGNETANYTNWDQDRKKQKLILQILSVCLFVVLFVVCFCFVFFTVCRQIF